MFLWLAGLAVVLAATRSAERTGSRSQAFQGIVRRGLLIFLLAFLFRIQAFIITPGNHIVTVFRVDILNIMGPAIVMAAVVWVLFRSAAGRIAAFSAVAIAVGLLTPIVRASPLLAHLPVWVQWHMRPAGELTLFSFWPWAGFVFAGGAVGALLANVREEHSERRANIAVAVCGAALVGIGLYTAARPSIYAAASFWTSSPTWFAIRLGIVMLALSAVYGLEQLVGPRPDTNARTFSGLVRTFALPWQTPLARLGQHSLFIYWIHVELVYGYSSWLWRHRLPLWGTAIAYVLFCVLMYRAIGWRDRVVGFWRARPRTSVLQPQLPSALH
jgi:uncharacterized membrane protein